MEFTRTSWIILIAATVMLGSCDKDEPTEPCPAPVPTLNSGLRLTIALMWDGAPFDQNTEYRNVNDYRVVVQFVKFYLAKMELLQSGTATSVFEIDLFDVTSGPVSREYTAAPGLYDELHFDLGVPYDLNHSNPAIYPASHPLSSTNGTTWNWNTDFYRFLLFDGRWDSDGSSTVQPLPFGFSIHTGRDTCYSELQFNHSINVVQDQYTDVRLEVDVSRFFYSASDTLDLTEGSQAHGVEVPLALLLTENAVGSFSIQ